MTDSPQIYKIYLVFSVIKTSYIYKLTFFKQDISCIHHIYNTFAQVIT
nr:MAG TPA: hypothetical protein [Caudoviricetes sp.]